MLTSVLMIMQKKDLSNPFRSLKRFTLVRLASIFLGNIGYACWRRHHWDGRFSSYYAHASAKSLEKGKVPHIMHRKRHGPAAILAGGKMLPPSQPQQHGRYAFKKIVELGLQPHDMCVDFVFLLAALHHLRPCRPLTRGCSSRSSECYKTSISNSPSN